MKKSIIVIAMAIWVADVALLIHGKYFLRIMEFFSYNFGDVSGIVKVKFSMSTVLDLLCSSGNRRSVLLGHL